jgi:hypothetical protein
MSIARAPGKIGGHKAEGHIIAFGRSSQSYIESLPRLVSEIELIIFRNKNQKTYKFQDMVCIRNRVCSALMALAIYHKSDIVTENHLPDCLDEVFWNYANENEIWKHPFHDINNFIGEEVRLDELTTNDELPIITVEVDGKNSMEFLPEYTKQSYITNNGTIHSSVNSSINPEEFLLKLEKDLNITFERNEFPWSKKEKLINLKSELFFSKCFPYLILHTKNDPSNSIYNFKENTIMKLMNEKLKMGLQTKHRIDFPFSGDSAYIHYLYDRKIHTEISTSFYTSIHKKNIKLLLNKTGEEFVELFNEKNPKEQKKFVNNLNFSSKNITGTDAHTQSILGEVKRNVKIHGGYSQFETISVADKSDNTLNLNILGCMAINDEYETDIKKYLNQYFILLNDYFFQQIENLKLCYFKNVLNCDKLIIVFENQMRSVFHAHCVLRTKFGIYVKEQFEKIRYLEELLWKKNNNIKLKNIEIEALNNLEIIKLNLAKKLDYIFSIYVDSNDEQREFIVNEIPSYMFSEYDIKIQKLLLDELKMTTGQHKYCSDYCKVVKINGDVECKFGFKTDTKPQTNKSFIMTERIVSKKSNKPYFVVRYVAKRNNLLVINVSRHLNRFIKANTDVQFIQSEVKALNYVLQYVLKKKRSSKFLKSIFTDIFEKLKRGQIRNTTYSIILSFFYHISAPIDVQQSEELWNLIYKSCVYKSFIPRKIFWQNISIALKKNCGRRQKILTITEVDRYMVRCELNFNELYKIMDKNIKEIKDGVIVKFLDEFDNNSSIRLRNKDGEYESNKFIFAFNSKKHETFMIKYKIYLKSLSLDNFYKKYKIYYNKLRLQTDKNIFLDFLPFIYKTKKLNNLHQYYDYVCNRFIPFTKNPKIEFCELAKKAKCDYDLAIKYLYHNKLLKDIKFLEYEKQVEINVNNLYQCIPADFKTQQNLMINDSQKYQSIFNVEDNSNEYFINENEPFQIKKMKKFISKEIQIEWKEEWKEMKNQDIQNSKFTSKRGIDLNEEQKMAMLWLKFQLITQNKEEIGFEIGELPNVLLCAGDPGTGKSTWIKELLGHMKDIIFCMGPTGLVAGHLEGFTIHSGLNIHFHSFRMLKAHEVLKLRRFYNGIKIIVLDEIFMTSARLFNSVINFI